MPLTPLEVPNVEIPHAEVVSDDRGRVSLQGLVNKNAIYTARRFHDGSVILEPARLNAPIEAEGAA